MKTLLIASLFSIFFAADSYSQNCEEIVGICEKLLKTAKGQEFVSDGQVYSAFLDREKAQFKTTFFGGSTYRIAASAGSKQNFVIFTVRDVDKNILYSNKNYKNAPYWDFKVLETIEVSIETEMDLDLKGTGCAVMLIGFKK